MLIKSVELKNIKSYRHGTIEFKEGINGISGLNGHGKTTILEAIGYVLFDYLPYSEKDFKRRGEKSAYVTVEVVANGTIYRLTKKLGGEFTVRGPDTNITGKKDALAWLAHNLFPFSNLDELPGIFENAVGVPQGMFTAAFINPPVKRKLTFDEILKVEEYRKAYDNLRDTMALIDTEINSIENDINGLRIRTEGYGKKKDERDKLKVSVENLKIDLKEFTESVNSKKIILEALRKQKEELEKLNSEINQLNAKLEGQNQQLKKTKEELGRSEEAQKTIFDLSGMKKKYEQARKNLERLDELRKNREVIVDKLNKIQSDRSLLTDKKIRINLLKAEIEKKTEEKNAILPFIKEQVELEKKKEGANQERAIFVKEISDIKSRMNLASAKNICPVMKGVRCNSINDLSEYFREQLEGARSNLKVSMNSLKTLESQLNELGDPRSKVNGFEMLIKNRTEEAAKLSKEIESFPEKENAANELKINLENYKTIDDDMRNAKGQTKELEPFYQKYLQNQSLAARVTENKNEFEKQQKSIVEGEEKYKELQKRINEMRKGFSETDLAETQRTYEEMVAKVRGFQVEIKEKEVQLQKLNRDILEMEKYLSGIAELEVKLENEKRFRDYAKFIRETLRDSGQHIVIELIGEIEEEANSLYCSIMDDFSQELRWSEDYEIKIIDSGEEKIFQQLSGGEKMGAALAVRLALLKILSNSDFVFLDEPTQNMDEIRRENLSEQITKIKGFKQVFVISHDDTFNEKYAHVIKVQKIDGESRVETCLT
ncbi:DNA double-strand break repair Rad50 ATPase [uncultured archaeon]|nr:DNA double-strand break repair Rad50 ATPase [uncultured archaeon]